MSMTGNPPAATRGIPGPGVAPSSYEALLERIDAIDPRAYDKTRNYLDGAVTWLSPYITHGVINTRLVAERVLARHAPKHCYRLLYELGWREYFHRVWQELDDEIFTDVRQAQARVQSQDMPCAILSATTGIQTLDRGIQCLIETGWMHNHLRMWVAGTTCNIAQTAWRTPAAWMYYHLLDGDLASNTLSWQWIAGTFSHKRYIANQDNINKYSKSRQQGTCLDVDYETLADMPVPEVLQARLSELDLPQELPGEPVPQSLSGRFALRSIWNLQPEWMAELPQAVFIERRQAEAWPMAAHRWAFIQHWARQLDVPIWSGSQEDLERLSASGAHLVREEYPACRHWPGEVLPRPFHFARPERPYRSFSQFWKQVQ